MSVARTRRRSEQHTRKCRAKNSRFWLTIKVLNDDDALELFNNILPGSSASLLQDKKTAKAMAKSAFAALTHACNGGTDPRVIFFEIALEGIVDRKTHVQC